MSANAFQEDVYRDKDAGMNGLAMKPVDLGRPLAAPDKRLPQSSGEPCPDTFS